MPDQTVSTPPEYADDDVMLRVDAATASRATLRLAATAVGIRTVIEMSPAGADYIGRALMNVATATTAAADLTTDEDQP